MRMYNIKRMPRCGRCKVVFDNTNEECRICQSCSHDDCVIITSEYVLRVISIIAVFAIKEKRREKLKVISITRDELVSIKGSQCEYCGYDRCLSILQFHHRDPSTKYKEVAQMVDERYPREEILAEVDKCDLICNRCHMELHFGLSKEYLFRYIKK